MGGQIVGLGVCSGIGQSVVFYLSGANDGKSQISATSALVDDEKFVVTRGNERCLALSNLLETPVSSAIGTCGSTDESLGLVEGVMYP